MFSFRTLNAVRAGGCSGRRVVFAVGGCSSIRAAAGGRRDRGVKAACFVSSSSSTSLASPNGTGKLRSALKQRLLSSGGLKDVYERPRGRKPTPEEEKRKQGQIVIVYALVLGSGLYLYSHFSTRKSTNVAAELVDQARNHELESEQVYTENERIKALRLAEAKYLEAIKSLDLSLAETAQRQIDRMQSKANKNKNDFTESSEFEAKDSIADTAWLSEDIKGSWYPPLPPSFVLPHSGSEESTTLIRALKGLANLKRTHGQPEKAEATQLRLVGTLRSAKGMHSLETIEACRELGWIYFHHGKSGDAIGVLNRSLELAEKSRARGQAKIEICAALSEDLSMIFRSIKRYNEAVMCGEKAVKLLEKGSGGRNDPRCGVLWTAITADWQKLQDLSSMDKHEEIAEEVYFAAKEAVRVARSTAPSRTKNFSADAWQCAAYRNMLVLLVGMDKSLERARDHLRRTQEHCPHLKKDPVWLEAERSTKEYIQEDPTT